ncbi:MAG TPA: PDZ domain-containing protein [Casimicrobiaceae bacterium]|nr:PDZ domain-containing protein [Casimicrobiaceae bacterium]
MKTIVRNLFGTALFVVTLGAHAVTDEATDKAHQDVIRGWMESVNSQDGFIAYVNIHLAEDAKYIGQPYIGLGINTSSDMYATGHLVALHVRPGEPAATAGIKDGDEIYSVGGVRVSKKNQDRLPFHGKAGEKVLVVVLRGGKQVSVTVIRGRIENTRSKPQFIQDLRDATPADFASQKSRIDEILGNGSVYFVRGRLTAIEPATKLPFEQDYVSRFEFDQAGKVKALQEWGQDEYVQSQLGFKVSR